MLSLGRDGWRRAGFELAIVFLGVLVALLVDGWNERRVQRGVEQEYLARLAQDVAADVSNLTDLAETLDTKSAALRWLLGAEASGLASQTDSLLLARLVDAHSAGFGVLRGVSTTFEDLRGTGNLGLITDSRVRARIVSYYEAWDFNSARVVARRADFPSRAYRLLPPDAYDADVSFDAPASQVPSDFDRSETINFLTSRQTVGSLRGESNYARFFAGVVTNLRSEAEALLVALAEVGP